MLINFERDDFCGTLIYKIYFTTIERIVHKLSFAKAFYRLLHVSIVDLLII